MTLTCVKGPRASMLVAGRPVIRLTGSVFRMGQVPIADNMNQILDNLRRR